MQVVVLQMQSTLRQTAMTYEMNKNILFLQRISNFTTCG